MNLAELKRKSIKELADMAAALHVEGAASMRRQELIFALLRAESSGETIEAEGVIEVLADGFGFLRAPDGNYQPGADDVYVSPSQIRRFNLRTGDTVTGRVRPPKESERYFALLRVEQVNHRPPESVVSIQFDDMTPEPPSERLRLGHDPSAVAAHLIDRLCPIGKGQRCLVIAPRRSGKTALLEQIAQGLAQNHPDVEVIALLVDERPEDVTEARRQLPGDVVASTFDESATRHVQVADIVIEKAKRSAETGHDVVLLLDSVSLLARAYDAACPAGGKLAGGLDVTAIHRTKRVLGCARNLAEGGSLTIIATAEDDPADRGLIDQLAGVANAELRLDAGLAAQRVFPALDLARCWTRHDERLLDADELVAARALQAELVALDSAAAVRRARAWLDETPPPAGQRGAGPAS